MLIYGLKTCDTCRKVRKLLGDVQFVDVRETPLSQEVLERALAQFGADLVNTRSTTWRSLSESERQRPHIELLSAHPALMKRPLIEDMSGKLHLGWSADVQAAVLPG